MEFSHYKFNNHESVDHSPEWKGKRNRIEFLVEQNWTAVNAESGPIQSFSLVSLRLSSGGTALSCLIRFLEGASNSDIVFCPAGFHFCGLNIMLRLAVDKRNCSEVKKKTKLSLPVAQVNEIKNRQEATKLFHPPVTACPTKTPKLTFHNITVPVNSLTESWTTYPRPHRKPFTPSTALGQCQCSVMYGAGDCFRTVTFALVTDAVKV